MSRIYGLTWIGKAAAARPNANNTVGLKVINFMRRNGGQASDDLISNQTGVDAETIASLARRKPAPIAVIG